MARIALGIWTSHGPTLSTRPEQWTERLVADRANGRLMFRGQAYDFDTLAAKRAAEKLAARCTLEERRARYERCQLAIDVLADRYVASRCDAAVILGNDQRELFLENLTPAFTIFTGQELYGEPATPEQELKMPPGIKEAEWGCKPPEYTRYRGEPELALRILAEGTAAGFDLTRLEKLPHHAGHWSSGISHAFGFIYRRVMRDRVPPNVPVITNTFFPPNQPTARRCFDLGRQIGVAIRDWPVERRVAVVGSGGMSHFVIDEEFDQQFLEALAHRDAERLCAIDERYFQSGTSELKNWIVAAGVLFESELEGSVIDYQACYRSEAGTGTANGFVSWQ